MASGPLYKQQSQGFWEKVRLHQALNCFCFVSFLVIGFLPHFCIASASGKHYLTCRATLLTKAQEEGLKVSVGRFYEDHGESFLKDIDDLIRTAEHAGLSTTELLDVLHILLNSKRPRFLEIGDYSKFLIQSFETARRSSQNLSAQVQYLERIVAVKAIRSALVNLPLAIRYGWTLQQTADLYGDLEQFQGGFEENVYQFLPKLMRSMISYNIDKQVSFLALKRLFREQYIEAPIEDLPSMIEYIELEYGLSADLLFKAIPEAVARSRSKGDFPGKGIEDSFSNLIKGFQPRIGHSSGFQERFSFDMYFPFVTGPVRHSYRPYRLHRKFDDGISDLRELCLSFDEEREGAFVFDPKKELWFSLGGVTKVDHSNHILRTTFGVYDLGELSSNPKFIHIHPKSLEWWSSMHFEKPARLFPVILPSGQDISTFLNFVRETQHETHPEFVIVHSLGKTIIQLGEDLSEVERIGQQFIEIRDSLLLEGSTNLGNLKGRSTQDVLQRLVNRLNEKLNGQIQIRLEFAGSDGPEHQNEP